MAMDMAYATTAKMSRRFPLFSLIVLASIGCCYSFPEKGKWTQQITVTVEKDTALFYNKIMFADTRWSLKVNCSKKASYIVSWTLLRANCLYTKLNDTSTLDVYHIGKERFVSNPNETPVFLDMKHVEPVVANCIDETYLNLTLLKLSNETDPTSLKPLTTTTTTAAASTAKSTTEASAARRKREETEHNEPPAGATEKSTTTPAKTTQTTSTTQSSVEKSADEQSHPYETTLTTTWEDGQYVFILIFKPKPADPDKPEKPTKLTVDMETRDSKDHLLSAPDLPFYYFYLILMILYVLYGFFWFIMLGCYWRDLLQIQYFIGIVIILGLIEKAFHFAEYEYVDEHGETSKSRVIVAEIVSSAKRTLSRALVVVVSVGFGLVKPRLGPVLHKLLALCFVYFILASVESCLRAMRMSQETEEESKADLIAAIPVALADVGFIYWVFTSLQETKRALRLRRNVVKLSLYMHFTNLIIFAILASIGFFIWFMKEIRFSNCVSDIRELWLETGFWTLLFTIMLFVIMILWRPSINNQRFSHSPLLDAGDDEEEDTLMMTEAFDAKKRNQLSNGKAPREKKSREEKVEEDLQWIEDNIPASVGDAAAQAVMNDSEDELMTTRFELSKMD